jgi:hypothetical protein
MSYSQAAYDVFDSISIPLFDNRNISKLIGEYAGFCCNQYYVQTIGGFKDVAVSNVYTRFFSTFSAANDYFISELSYLQHVTFKNLIQTCYDKFSNTTEFTISDYYYLYLLFGPKGHFFPSIFFKIDIENYTFQFYVSKYKKRPINITFIGMHPILEWYQLWVQFCKNNIFHHDKINIETIDLFFQHIEKDEFCQRFEETKRIEMENETKFYEKIYGYNYCFYTEEEQEELNLEANRYKDQLETYIHNIK